MLTYYYRANHLKPLPKTKVEPCHLPLKCLACSNSSIFLNQKEPHS